MTLRTSAFATALALGFAGSASANLFFDNFDVDSSGNWTVNAGPGDTTATFGFDYSTYGISSAPNSTGGTTRGLRLMANQSAGIFTGLSASPIGGNFTGDYKVRADVWLNYVGPLGVGGSGSTQAGGMGILTAGGTPQWAGGTQDSVWFATTTDGNSAADWRAYSPAAGVGYGDTSGVFAAGNTAGVRNHNHPYYAGFGGVSAPAAQVGLFPGQTGTTLVGSAGFEWHDFEVMKIGNTVTWTVGGLLIATVDVTGMSGLGGSNFHLNYFDTNATSSADPNDFLNAIIFDNVRVAAVPEPGTMAALGLGLAAVLRRKRS